LRHPQAPRGARLAQAPSPGPVALHPDLGLLAEPGGGVLSIITRQALRRGSFPTVADLIAAIQRFIDAWNDRRAPFTWTKDPDTVIAKATDPRRRKTQQTSETEHWLHHERGYERKLWHRLIGHGPEYLPDWPTLAVTGPA
jgi:hypothetical protein